MAIFLGESLHLIIQILLLVDVQVLVCLVNDGLSDSVSSTLLLVVVKSGIDPSLLARAHV